MIRKILFSMIMLPVYIAISISTSYANNINLQFQFNVSSSGESLYLCNAALSTYPNTGIQYFDLFTSAQITAAQCQVSPNSCVIIDINDQYKKNSFYGFTGVWGSKVSSTAFNILSASHENIWGSGPSNGSVWPVFGNAGLANVISDLTFSLASPVQNAHFFIDVCYRGPQIEYYQKYGNVLPLKWALTTSVTSTNLNPDPSYIVASGLNVQNEVACDLQGIGTQIYAKNSSGLYNTLNNDEMEGSLYWGFSSTADMKKVLNGTYNLAAAGTVNLFNGEIIADSSAIIRAPRFCKIRFFFEENSSIRSWIHVGSLFTLSVKVESLAN